jgi:alkanesulfonate monooxygenase SsuD/methylene tetrahydromethanopterin reductase-like flavin-dependent oxidoreductase (luciferase family)
MNQFRRLGSRIAASGDRAGTPGQEETTSRSQHLAGVTWDEVMRDKVAVGTPDMVIERLQEMKERLQLSGVVAEFNAGGTIPPERVAASLDLFCEKVAPAFK